MIRWSKNKPTEGESIDVSENGTAPWNRLSQDFQHGQIPVPGILGMYSESVRGVMEGLKLIGPCGKAGAINTGFFTGSGRPRELKDGEWLLGYRFESYRINLSDANREILARSYVWMLCNKTSMEVAKLKQLGGQNDIFVYDGLTGDQPFDDEPYSAASILVAFCNNRIDEILTPPVMQ